MVPWENEEAAINTQLTGDGDIILFKDLLLTRRLHLTQLVLELWQFQFRACFISNSAGPSV